jgi:hypothetical protein
MWEEFMDKAKRYGKSDTELAVDARATAREIVQEVLNFGVSQQQILYIVYLLALELEDRDAMLTISNSVKQLLENIGDSDEDEPANNNPTGILTT